MQTIPIFIKIIQIASESAIEVSSQQPDLAPALLALETDIHAQLDDLPVIGTTGMRLFQPNPIVDLDGNYPDHRNLINDNR